MSKGKILIIEDESGIVRVISHVLKDEGYEVLSAGDGVKGINMLDQDKPDLLILDMNLPKKGGLSVYHHIANTLDGSPRLPVLVITGRSELEDFFRDVKVDGFMVKPFKIYDLVAQVNSIFEKRYGKKADSAAAEAASKKRIFLVESDDSVFDAATPAFVNGGYELVRIKDIQQLLQKAGDEKPRAIFMKLESGQLMGPESMMISRLQQAPQCSGIPVFLYAAAETQIDSSKIEQFRAMKGVSEFVVYNSPHELLKVLEKITF